MSNSGLMTSGSWTTTVSPVPASAPGAAAGAGAAAAVVALAASGAVAGAGAVGPAGADTALAAGAGPSGITMSAGVVGCESYLLSGDVPAAIPGARSGAIRPSGIETENGVRTTVLPPLATGEG